MDLAAGADPFSISIVPIWAALFRKRLYSFPRVHLNEYNKNLFSCDKEDGCVLCLFKTAKFKISFKKSKQYYFS